MRTHRGPRNVGVLVSWLAQSRTETAKECTECGARTWGGKPYCPDHLELMPYVRQLLPQIARRERKRQRRRKVKT